MDIANENITPLISSRWCFSVCLCIICIALPLGKFASSTNLYFKWKHNLNHHFIPNKMNFLHRSFAYHNRSIKLVIFWSLLLCLMILYGSNGDFKLITKKCGRISVACLPIVLLLSVKPSFLPNFLYLSLLPIHKWLSRIIVLQATVHSILYLYWFIYSKSFKKKMLKLTNIYGVIAWVLFLLIAFSSVNKLRRVNFKRFYYIHYVSTWLSILFIQLHSVPSVNYYCNFCYFILLCQIIYKFRQTKVTNVSITKISDTISLMKFPVSALSNKPILPATHVRINQKIVDGSFWKRITKNYIIPLQHPFTIANLPNEDTVKIIIRNGETLAIDPNAKYYVTGVFEPKICFISKERLASLLLRQQKKQNFPFQINSIPLLSSPLSYHINARRVMMCVGGTAISFALPMLRILNFNGVNVRLIWVTRDYHDLQLLNHFKNNFEGLEVYVSGANSIDYVEQYNREQQLNNDLENQMDEHASLSTATLTPANYGSMATGLTTNDTATNGPTDEDEIDFTNEFSIKSAKSQTSLKTSLANKSAFRGLSVIKPPSDEQTGQAGGTDQNDTNKLQIPAGIKVFFGRPSLDQSHYNWCLEKECIGPSPTNQCCHPNNQNSSHVDDLSTVWVVAAGPASLVENTRRWATDGGLHFYAESYAV